jgi:hypothetical protein
VAPTDSSGFNIVRMTPDRLDTGGHTYHGHMVDPPATIAISNGPGAYLESFRQSLDSRRVGEFVAPAIVSTQSPLFVPGNLTVPRSIVKAQSDLYCSRGHLTRRICPGASRHTNISSYVGTFIHRHRI